MKTFVCDACHREYEKVYKLQPVITKTGHLCQHCWASATWGKNWADKCRAKEPRMYPINLQQGE